MKLYLIEINEGDLLCKYPSKQDGKKSLHFKRGVFLEQKGFWAKGFCFETFFHLPSHELRG